MLGHSTLAFPDEFRKLLVYEAEKVLYGKQPYGTNGPEIL
jgi:hypothetical protein